MVDAPYGDEFASEGSYAGARRHRWSVSVDLEGISDKGVGCDRRYKAIQLHP
jgi:hypothetical protein